MVREIFENELNELFKLYLSLHEKSIPEMSVELEKIWEKITADENYHIIVNEIDGRIVSSCVCVVIPNLTRGCRPYAFIENVVTQEEYRGKGYAAECLDYAKAIAKNAGCYKMMLMSSSKNQNTLDFYRNAGYNSEDKTAFIQWIE